ncbi:MAG: ABC transporter permease [Eubacteriales bacterium]|nr:ABC transporter permease [Eubacteriales bacterium]
MKAVMKREMKNYLKQPFFWIGVLIVFAGVFQTLGPYLKISYVTSDEEIAAMRERTQSYDDYVPEADTFDGYIPASEEERRAVWEQKIYETLVSGFELEPSEAEAVVEKVHEMEVSEACAYLEETFQWGYVIYDYTDAAYRRATKEEINAYLDSQMERKPFSYYFSRKFADFAGLWMGFFAAIVLAALFWQDTRKHTYELLHTKPVRAGSYVMGKTAGGFGVCLLTLAILNVGFWALCRIAMRSSGFEVRIQDFLYATCVYILPNMLMIVCVYGVISLLFKNPLPAVPFLLLYIVYSNMGRRNEEGVFGYYGRPLAIMVRFPGPFFDTTPPPMVIQNQCFLLLASAVLILACVQLWKRRRT